MAVALLLRVSDGCLGSKFLKEGATWLATDPQRSAAIKEAIAWHSQGLQASIADFSSLQSCGSHLVDS